MSERMDGWKAISEYLGRAERTVQTWEKSAGLPIHRLRRTTRALVQRGRVFAYGHELDRWLSEGGRALVAATEFENGSPAPWKQPRYLVATILVAAAAFGVWLLSGDGGNPHSVTLQGNNQLVAFNAAGQRLWVYPIEGQIKLPGAIPSWQPVDLDGDGSNEVLFVVTTTERGQPGQRLVCLNADGKLRWQYLPGKQVVWNGVPYAPTYAVKRIDYLRRGDGQKQVLVVATHAPFHPTQVSILDGKGKLRGEYWNTGYVFALLTFDIDGNGAEEIVLGGINNYHGRRAFLAAIRPDLQGAISPVPPGFAPGLRAGLEEAYLLFPRTDVADALLADSRVFAINRSGRGLGISLEIRGAYESLERVYILQSSLQPKVMEYAQQFLMLRERLVAEGIVSGLLDEAETERLMQPEVLVRRRPP